MLLENVKWLAGFKEHWTGVDEFLGSDHVVGEIINSRQRQFYGLN